MKVDFKTEFEHFVSQCDMKKQINYKCYISVCNCMTISLSSPSNPAKEENPSKHCGLGK